MGGRFRRYNLIGILLVFCLVSAMANVSFGFSVPAGTTYTVTGAETLNGDIRGTLIINSGGAVTVNSIYKLQGDSGNEAQLIINEGGSFTANARFNLQGYNQTGRVIMNGGTAQFNGDLKIPDSPGGKIYLDLFGGTFTITQVQLDASRGAEIRITGGALILDGARVPGDGQRDPYEWINQTNSQGNAVLAVGCEGGSLNFVDFGSDSVTVTAICNPTVQFDATESNGSEAVSPVSIDVVLSEAQSVPVEVFYEVSGTATGGGTDYTLANGSVTFAAGQVLRNIIIPINNDHVPEPDETIVITLTSVTGADVILGGNIVHTHTINDTSPSIFFNSSASDIDEDGGTALVTVELSHSFDQNVNVIYGVSGGTAIGGGDDYTIIAGMMTFIAGQTSKDIPISIVNDSTPEVDETIILEIVSTSSNATLGSVTQHTLTILDNNPTVEFDMATSQGPESTSPVNITVSLNRIHTETVTVYYAVTGGNAVRGRDFVLDDGTVTFLAGQKTKNISIYLADDDIEETPDETIVLTLSNQSSNASLGSITEHTFTIFSAVLKLCPKGDLDFNCSVNLVDVGLFALQWLDLQGVCNNTARDCANLNGITGVDLMDYSILANNFGKEGLLLVINEFMASNASAWADPENTDEYPDWIELYNAGPSLVDLSGMYLTDDLGEPTMWRIPNGVIIDPCEFLVFYADGRNSGNYHTNFELSAGGEEIALFSADGITLFDSIKYADQTTDISYGRYPDATTDWRFFYIPTPGWANDGAYEGVVADTKFSHDRGFYEDSNAFDLNITCATPGAVIRYTTDGTKPTLTNGSVFNPSTPIHISTTSHVRAAAFLTGWMPSNVDTHTYIFLSDVLTQSNLNQSFLSGYSTAELKDSLKSIPTLSIVKNPAEPVIDDPQGAYGGTSVELIYPDSNSYESYEGFQTDCQISMHSHDKGDGKQAYRLEFKSGFGPASLNYPFFESAPVNAESVTDKFDRIILRAGSNTPVTFVGDQWAAQSQIAMSDIGSHSMHVHLYINGEYRGIYNPKERPDAWFTSAYFGGDFEDYFATNHGIERCTVPVSPDSTCHLSGDYTRFDRMMELAYERDMANSVKYAEMLTLCDVTNFADYTILFWLSGFGDTMDNNWYAGMKNNPPGGFMMFMWDAEYVFMNEGSPAGHVDPWVPSYFWSSPGKYMISDIWQGLFGNADFRMLFADRVYKHCFNGGALTDQNAQDRWDALTADIDQAAILEYAMWEWIYTDSNPLRQLLLPPQRVDMTGHANIFINELRSASYANKLYPAIDPPVFQHGGIVTLGYSLTMTGSSTIYYTLDGTDPRASGGAVAGTQYSGPVILNKSTIVKARVKSGTEWSALHEAEFGVGPVKENLRITEIMYHPADDPNTEYIELRNISDTVTIDPACVSFTRGIDFTFSSMPILPGKHVVVVKNQAAFETKYGSGLPIAGQFTGSLENAGEKIILQDATGQTILNFTYKDSWYDITDGQGFSLTIKDANNPDLNSWDLKSSWRPSAVTGGSPGAGDSGQVPEIGAIKINELLAHSHNSSDWIELYNTTDEPINIGGWFLSDSGTNLMKYEIADGTVIGPGSYIVFDEDANFGNAADPSCHTPFALSENGETVYLRSGLNGVLTGYIEEEEFGASETDVSFGRYLKSTGTYNFTAMTSKTPGSVNSYPKVGPVVINEIMYNPDLPSGSPYDKEAYEYIELYNITGEEVQLYDVEGTPWKLTDGIDFTFPPSTVIAPHGYMLIVKNPAAFASRVGFDWPAVPLNVQILGPFDGQLNNGGEKIEFSMPGDVDEFGTRYYISVERITYSDGSHPVGDDPWPVEADGAGKSLSRKVPADYGNDVINFKAADPSPGIVNP